MKQVDQNLGVKDNNKCDSQKYVNDEPEDLSNGNDYCPVCDCKLNRKKWLTGIAVISTVCVITSILAVYCYTNRLYDGHDAKYWHDNRLYNEHDAKYWHDSRLYNGYDAKYWHENRLYSGHDAKYWHDNRLYDGHDAKYWYDNRLYSGHDAKYWYEKYTDRIKPR